MMHNAKFALVFIAGLGTAVVAQTPTTKEEKPTTPKTEPSLSLEKQVEKALANSADVLLAEAKVREAQSQLHTAEAVLRQTRSQVTQKVIETRRNADAQRKVFQAADSTYEVYRSMSGKGAGKIEVIKAEQEAMAAKAQLVEMETRLDMLTGQLPAGVLERLASVPSRNPQTESIAKRLPPPEMIERMRKALGQTIKVDNESLTTEQLAERIRSQIPTAPVFLAAIERTAVVKFEFKGDVTLAGCFQLVKDFTGNTTIVRDYGFLICGYNLPEDAITVDEFRRSFP